MQILDPRELAIYEFQPNNIIMIHKSTKLLYQYFQTSSLTFKQNNFLHQNLLTAVILPTGILYRKGITSLDLEINKRLHRTNKNFYQQQQLLNTFLPVLQCLQFLHSKEIVHANIYSQSIHFNEQGEVQLRDWLVEIPHNKYYLNENLKERTKHDDLQALGNLMLQISTLTEFSAQKDNEILENSLRKIINRYSRGWILAVFIMCKKIDKFYSSLPQILANDESFINGSEQLINLYNKLKMQKESKPIMPNLSFNCLSNGTNFNKNIQFTYKTPLQKKQKIQDSENKKNFQEQIKKKPSERVTKITEKCNNFEILKKTDMALKKMSNYKFNIATEREMEKLPKKSVKEDVLKFRSPVKRLKTNPKKKNI